MLYLISEHTVNGPENSDDDIENFYSVRQPLFVTADSPTKAWDKAAEKFPIPKKDDEDEEQILPDIYDAIIVEINPEGEMKQFIFSDSADMMDAEEVWEQDTVLIYLR